MPTPYPSRLSPPTPGLAPTARTTTGNGLTTGGGQQPGIDESLRVSATVAGFDGDPIATITRYHEPGYAELDVDRCHTVVAVFGDIDGDTAPTLRTALTEAITSQARVCCDLAHAAFFGAAGANTLLAAHHHATAAGCHFTVRGVHGSAQWILTVTGLDRLLTLHD